MARGPEATLWKERAGAEESMRGALSDRESDERRPEEVEARGESRYGESCATGDACSDDDVGGVDLDEPFDTRTRTPAEFRSYANERSEMESSEGTGDG